MMGDQDHLLRLTSSTTALGNSISLKMVEFLDHVKDQPLGFRDLGLDFLSICKILNSLQTSLQEHFRTGQPFPQQAIPELTKILDQTLHDFTQLQYLLEKFMEYEKGGTFAVLQKTWRQFFADKDISKVRSSLQTNKGALTMTMLLTNINTAQTSSPIGYEYGMLAAKLESPGSSTAVPPPQPSHPSPHPLTYSSLPPGSNQGNFQQTYNPQYQPPRPPAGPPPGWQGGQENAYMPQNPVRTPKPPPGPPPQSQPVQSVETFVQRKPMPPPGPPPGFFLETHPKVPKPPAGPPPGFQAPVDLAPRVPKPPPGPPPQTVIFPEAAVQKTPKPPAGPPPGFQVQPDSAPRTAQPPPGPPPASILPDITPSFSELAIAEKVLKDPWKIVRVTADPSKMPRRSLPQTVTTNVALSRTLVSAVSTGKHSMAEQLLNRGVSPNLEGDKIAIIEAVLRNDLTSLRLLLEFGADPNLKAVDGNPALRYASQYGYEEAATLLLSYGADPNIKMTNDWTALGWACSENKPEIVKSLLEYGADPNLPGPDPPVVSSLRYADCMRYLVAGGADIQTEKTLMEKAVYFNQIEVVKALLDGNLDPNTKDEYYIPLNTSIRDGLFEITALLLSRGANPNAKGGEGFPIEVAATKPEAIKLLLGAGVDTMKPGVLEKAVYQGSIASIPILLDAGYPITGLEDDYHRPLNTAVRDSKPEYLNLLLSRGADPNVPGGEGYPIQIAATLPDMLKILITAGADVKKPGVLEKAVYRQSIESIPILLDAGYPIAGLPDDHYRPLTTAVRDNLGEILQLLLSRGADPNLAGGEGLPLVIGADKPAVLEILLSSGRADVMKAVGALEKACFRDRIESIPLLLDAGFPINGHPDDYYRPLHTAVRENNAPIVALLLSRGADPNFQGGEGLPLQIAATKPEILKQLITGGADCRKAKGVIEKAVFRNSVESIPILVAAGAPIDGHPEDYYRPLYTAVRDNLPECMSQLLSLGADPNIIAGQGSPFLLAASHEDPTKLKILLDAGADVNLDQDGITALMRACEHNLVGNVKLLLEKGANAHIVDSRERTAMEIASEKGHDDLVMLLLEAMS